MPSGFSSCVAPWADTISCSPSASRFHGAYPAAFTLAVGTAAKCGDPGGAAAPVAASASAPTAMAPGSIQRMRLLMLLPPSALSDERHPGDVSPAHGHRGGDLRVKDR